METRFDTVVQEHGINIIEDQPEFKKNFGFEVNLGLLKFSWGVSEK